MACKIIPKRIKHIDVRLFEEEIEEVDFLCEYYGWGYEQLLVKLTKERLDALNIKESKSIKNPFRDGVL